MLYIYEADVMDVQHTFFHDKWTLALLDKFSSITFSFKIPGNIHIFEPVLKRLLNLLVPDFIQSCLVGKQNR